MDRRVQAASNTTSSRGIDILSQLRAWRTSTVPVVTHVGWQPRVANFLLLDQNVNKVSTKATLRCPIHSLWIPLWAREQIKKTVRRHSCSLVTYAP